jgi:hypothetical protein
MTANEAVQQPILEASQQRRSEAVLGKQTMRSSLPYGDRKSNIYLAFCSRIGAQSRKQ